GTEGRIESQVRSLDRPEVVYAAVVHGEQGLERNVVEIGSKLGVVRADIPRKVIAELKAPLSTLDVRVRFASEVGKSSDIDRRSRARGNAGVVKVRETAPGVLKTEIVHLVVADNCGFLGNDGKVTVCLFRGARVGILSERLDLSTDFNSVNRTGADVTA